MRRYFIILLMSFFLSLSTSYAMTLTPPYTSPLLVKDMDNVGALPARFRTTSDSLPLNSHINVKGLAKLHMVGSAQFSKAGLLEALKRIPSSHITVIDLRQESHGFINDMAVSWYGPGNAINAGYTPKEIEARQASCLRSVRMLKETDLYQIISKTAQEEIAEAEATKVTIQQVASESELLERNHLYSVRFYIADFHAPVATEVNAFIRLVRHLPLHEWIYFHCRAGEGRTTTFMVLYDMMKNAKFVSFDDIIARQAALGGKDLAELPAQGSYKYNWAVERLQFLHDFYEYARSNEDNFQTMWSDWVKG